MPSPTDISDLKYWLDASSGRYDATSGGSSVTADAANIASWEPVAGTVVARSTQATVNRRPIYDATKGLVVCDATKAWDEGNFLGRCGFDLPASFAIDRQAFSAFAICEAAVYGGLGVDHSHITDAGNGCVLLSDADTGKIGGYDGTLKLGEVASIPSLTRCLVGWVGGVSALKIWNNTAVASAAALGLGSITLTAIMYDPAGVRRSGTWGVRDWLFYDKALSDTEVTETILPWATTRGIVTDSTSQLLCVGDSITVGYGPPCNRNWPSRLPLSGVRIKSCAQHGETAAVLASHVSSGMVPQMQSGDVAIIWAGTNDITNGATAADTYSSLSSMVSAFHNVGVKAVLVTPLPRGSNTLSAGLASLRSLILVNTAGADVIADPDTNQEILNHWNDRTYDFDGTHLNDAGSALIASLLRESIRPLFSRDVGGGGSSHLFFGFKSV